jgi:hypothetical protein
MQRRREFGIEFDGCGAVGMPEENFSQRSAARAYFDGQRSMLSARCLCDAIERLT